MGFAAGALKGLTDPILRRQQEDEALSRQIRQMIAQTAMQGLLDPATDPALRDQYRRFLASDPNYKDFAGISFPDTPQAKLSRELGPLLTVAQAAGVLGPAGLLTPELAGQLESTAGRKVFPRRTTTQPGPVLEPAFPGQEARPGRAGLPPEPQVRGPDVTTESIDVSRFAPGIRIKLHTGQEVGLDELKGLPSDYVMFLVLGPRAAGARTYGDLFPNALKPAWKSVPIQVNENGRIVFPPEHAFLSPSEQAPSRTLGEVFPKASLRPEFQNAPATYDARGQLEYPPAHVFVDRDVERFERARRAWVTAKAEGASDEEAYRRAFAEDPKFPKPATLPAPPAPLTPQQDAWSKFFKGGIEALTPGERAYIENQLKENAADPELAQALQTINALSTKYRGQVIPPGDAVGRAAYQEALDVIARKFGVPVTEQDAPQPGRLAWLWAFLTGKAPPGPTSRTVPGREALNWAQAQLAIFRSKGGAKTKQDLQREFNRARRHKALKGIPLTHWRALQDLILQTK